MLAAAAGALAPIRVEARTVIARFHETLELKLVAVYRDDRQVDPPPEFLRVAAVETAGDESRMQLLVAWRDVATPSADAATLTAREYELRVAFEAPREVAHYLVMTLRRPGGAPHDVLLPGRYVPAGTSTREDDLLTGMEVVVSPGRGVVELKGPHLRAVYEVECAYHPYDSDEPRLCGLTMTSPMRTREYSYSRTGYFYVFNYVTRLADERPPATRGCSQAPTGGAGVLLVLGLLGLGRRARRRRGARGEVFVIPLDLQAAGVDRNRGPRTHPAAVPPAPTTAPAGRPPTATTCASSSSPTPTTAPSRPSTT